MRGCGIDSEAHMYNEGLLNYSGNDTRFLHQKEREPKTDKKERFYTIIL